MSVHTMALTDDQVDEIIEKEMRLLLDMLATDDDRSYFDSEEERSDLVKAAQTILGWYGVEE